MGPHCKLLHSVFCVSLDDFPHNFLETYMIEEEIKEWDDALLDLIRKGLVEIVHCEDGTVGFHVVSRRKGKF